MTLFQHGGIVKTNATQFCSAVDLKKKKRGCGGGRFHGTWKPKLAEIRLDKNSTVIYDIGSNASKWILYEVKRTDYGE